MASIHRRAVGIFPSRTKTASALQALKDCDLSMSHISVIAKDADQQANIAGITVKDEVTNQADTAGTVGAATGGLGGIAGLLVGLGALTIPGLGPALLVGEAGVGLATLVGGVAGAAAGGLVGTLIGLGIPEHRAAQYQNRVAQGDYLVMVKGTDDEIARAEQTLSSAGIKNWGVYQAADTLRQVEPQSHALSDRGHEVDRQALDNRHNLRAEPAAQQSASVTDVQRDRDLRQTRDRYPDTELPHASNPLPASGPAVTDRPLTERHSTAERRVVGVFPNQSQLEEALAQLQQTGFAMHTLSIAMREANAPSTGQQLPYGGQSLVRATRLTAGLDQVMLPEIGTLLVKGPHTKALSSAFVPHQPAQFGGIPQGLGIAPEPAHLYRRHLTKGAYFVTLRGRNQDVLQAAAILGKWGMHDWSIYDV